MLNYQSTSPHDAAGVRDLLGLAPAPEFAEWLERVGVYTEGRLSPHAAMGPSSLLALAESVGELEP